MLTDRVTLLVPILLFALSGCAQTDLEARVARLEVEADRQAVIRLMHDYAHGIDAMDVPLLERTFAEDAVAHYVGANFPMDAKLKGFDEILAWLRTNVGEREGALPWHFMSTARVDIQGDHATLRTFQHNRTMGGIGVYTVEAGETDEGWKIESLRLEERILDEALLEQLNREAPSASSEERP